MNNHQKSFRRIKNISLGLLALFLHVNGYTQSLTNKQVWDALNAIESDSAGQKLERTLYLKKKFEDNRLVKDSVYAKLLHKIGVYQHDAKQLNLAVANTREAIRINMSGVRGSSGKLAVNSYTNLAVFYQELSLPDKALLCFDSAILIARAYPDLQGSIIGSMADKCNILFIKGDYQKDLDEATAGQMLAQKNLDTANLIVFLNHQAQANLYQGKSVEALKSAERALQLAGNDNFLDERASSLKIAARVNALQKNISSAISLFRNAIATRLKTTSYENVADDYTDFGNFFLDEMHDYLNARKCYIKTSEYANKINDKQRLSKAHGNLGLVYFYQHNYPAAKQYYLSAFDDLQLNTGGNFLLNTSCSRLSAVGNTDLILAILNNKTELLLNLYKQTNERKYADACLQTALVTDSVITQTRFNQSAEQSKLYWRNKTRELFSNAMEASYLASKPASAFYFMEKSRAVLLNDKLNELGASVQLPLPESNKEQELRIHITEEEQKLKLLQDSTDDYKNQQQKLLEAKGEFERYIRSLEQKYPVYYQYKYDDNVPSLAALQQYLAANNQSFVHYFINDTVVYILGITSLRTKFIKLSIADFDENQLMRFLQLCSDRDELNNNYSLFISISNKIYKLLFEPLEMPKGRVIMCPDNFSIPFEALCTDTAGNNFLINDYAFSYVYSGRNLMKKIVVNEAKGNFIGFAPVKFQPYLGVPELSQSAVSLQKCAASYHNTELFINKEATRFHFLNSITDYTIVNIFSHASAGAAGDEPVLFMQDSIIRLSELQVLQNHVANLVILSACETNVGKSAPGEGIYSLARGFSAAGIPSVAATLWTADEETIYAISEKFHQYLSLGMLKDEALQKAKLYFLEKSGKEKSLPYYWANIILVGNAGPVKLLKNSNVSGTFYSKWKLVILGTIVLTFLVIVLRKIIR